MMQPAELRVPFATLLKIALAILLVLCAVRLWPVILMVVFAILIAVMLDPLVLWMERHRLSRDAGIAVVVVALFALLILFFAVLAPMISQQIADLSRQLPQIEQRIVRSFPAAGAIFASVRDGIQHIPQPQMRMWLTRGFVAGMYAIEGATAIVFVLVLAIYLLVEGRRAFAWLVSFAEPRTRERLVQTATESSDVVLAYVRGNILTSIICAAYVFAVLTALHIPGAPMLSVVAFLCDFVPVVGTIVQILPASAMALTVSPTRALLVIAAYVLYHLIENYLIIPRIYGRQMRLSTLTVLLALAVGATLQGVAGAVLVLPLAAVWPIVERIWLRESLPDDTIPMHDRLEGENKQVSEATTDEVLEEGRANAARGKIKS